MNSFKNRGVGFATTQRLKRQSEEIYLQYKDQTNTNVTTSCSYLGVEIDSTLNLTNFELCYKRVSDRLRLLSKLGCFMDSQTACEIYIL